MYIISHSTQFDKIYQSLNRLGAFFLVFVFIWSLNTVDCKGQTRLDDSIALVGLYAAASGSAWTNPWLLSQSMDNWYGVTLTNGRVTCLDLDGAPTCQYGVSSNGNGLSGNLPDLNLTALTFISLLNNNLTGNIPSFSNTQNLEWLLLDFNDFSGNIPNFSNLPELKTLSLVSNNLVGFVPNFPSLPKLERLLLNINTLSGNIPNFSGLPQLTNLSAYNNAFTGNIPNFSNLPNLEAINISRNQLSGGLPDFSSIPKLSDLDVYDNNLTGPIPNFSNLPLLRDCYLQSNEFSGTLPNFANLPELRRFNASSNMLTGTVPIYTGPTKITHLEVRSNQLTGSIPLFNNLPNLILINLSENQLTGTIPDFPSIPQLQSISISNNNLTGGIPDFTNLPALQQLIIRFNNLTGPIPDFSNLSSLNYAEFRDNNFIGPIPDFTNLPALTDLYLSDNQFSEPIPSFSNLSALEKLYFYRNQLTFDDLIDSRAFLENLCNSNGGTYLYQNQDSVSYPQSLNIPQGTYYTIDLEVDDTVTTSSYIWYKDNVYHSTTSINKLVIPNFQQSDQASYHSRITNPNAPALTLISHPKALFFQGSCVLDATIANTTCDEPNGSILLTTSGGTAPYNYLWSTGNTSPSLVNQPNGKYTVTVTDNAGCILNQSFIITHQEKPVIEWERSFGGTLEDQPFSVIQTSDGNYVTAGRTISTDVDVSSPKGDYDFWITKLTPNGFLIWEKSFGGSDRENAFTIKETADKGLIIAGESLSNDGDVTGQQGLFDYWIVKLDVNGNLVWQKTLGGSSTDQSNDIVENPDGSFVVVGQSISNDGDVTTQFGSYDYWVVKLDANGNKIWDKSYGGSNSDQAKSIIRTIDNGYVIAGAALSTDGQISNPKGGQSAWIIRIDSVGTLLWETSLGGTGDEYTEDILQTDDGGFLLCASTNSTDGDISTPLGSLDFWLVKLDAGGDLQWEKTFGGSDNDFLYDGFQKSDEEYILVGSSRSVDGNISNPRGATDYWMINIDNSGNLLWDLSMGGSDNEIAYGTCQTNDGGLMVAGRSISSDLDVSQNIGGFDNWIVKLNSNLPVVPICNTYNNGTGNADGEVEIITDTGSAFYSMDWENTSTNPTIYGTLIFGDGLDTIVGLENGDYNITVTDQNGCSGTSTFNVCDLLISLSATQTTCYEDNGSISVSVSGGSGTYTYQWSNGSTGAVISNLATGNYVLTVSDGIGCTKTVSTVLSFQGLPVIEWQNAIGGSGTDLGRAFAQSTDGGFVFTGFTESNDGDIPILKGDRDLVIGKTDQAGNLLWLQTYGGSLEDVGNNLLLTNNDEIYVIGTTSSSDGDISSNKGDNDILLMKLDPLGNLLWEKTFGGSEHENANIIKQLQNGDLLIACVTGSNDGEVLFNNGAQDIWVIRTDTAGNLLWQHSYGGPGNEVVHTMILEGNSFLIGGSAQAVGGDILSNNGGRDSWIFRSDFQGNITLNESFGDTLQEAVRSIKQTDTGYLTTGYTYPSASNSLYEIIQWDAGWNMIWQKTYGGTSLDFSLDALVTADKGSIVSGWANSSNGDVIGNHGGADNWILKLDENGDLQWQIAAGSSSHDTGIRLLYSNDGGFLTCGRASANNGDVSGHHGLDDIWIVKFNQPDPITVSCSILDQGTGNNDGVAVISTSGGIPPFTIAWDNGAGITDTLRNQSGQDTILHLPGGTINFTIIDINNCSQNCALDFCNINVNVTAQYTDCYEPNGALNTIVNPNYTYEWSNGVNLPNNINLGKGSYILTVTDNLGCSKTQSYIVSYNGHSALDWQKSLGGTQDDHLKHGIQTNDGGYIFTGRTASNDIDVTFNNGGEDIWVVKTDPVGNIEWQKSFGGSVNERSQHIQQTKDGGYMVTGRTSSTDGDAVGNDGGVDFWLLKLDIAGNLTWQKSFGGTLQEQAFQAQQTVDEGYIVIGHSYSIDGDVSGNKGSNDVWVVKTDKSGNLEWEKSLGGSDFDYGHSIQQTADRGFILTGLSFSNDGDVTGNKGDEDFWVVKLSALGTIEWQKSLGGSLEDVPNSIIQTNDKGYIVAGYTLSNDGDVFGNHGGKDFWVVKLNNQGNIEWQNALGGSGNEEATRIVQTSDGNYLVTGFTSSNNGDVTNNFNSTRFWVVKLLGNGILDWEMTMGGQTNIGYAHVGIPSNDGGYLFGGRTNSTDGDITNNIGNYDFWIAKINQTDTFQIEATQSAQILCSGTSVGAVTTSITGGYPPYTYYWSNGVYAQTITGLSANTYYVTTTDRNGCSMVDSVTIAEPLSLSIFSTEDSTYCNTNNGSITLTVNGGVLPYQYSLDGTNYQPGNVITNLGEGPYTVYVLDGNNCLDSIQTNIYKLEPATIDSLNTSPATCGSINGSITVFASNGTGNLEYSINGINYQPSNTLTNLAQGSYTVYVSDVAGCIVTTNAIIQAAPGPTISSINTTNAICGLSNGQATINATGGTTPLQYSIDNINYQPTPLFTGLAQGNYTAYVQDANACTSTASFNIIQANGPTISSISTTQATCGLSNGQATINATGGTTPIQYSIDNINYQSTALFTGLTQGNYTAYVQDANSCIATASFTITQANGPTISTVDTTQAICGLSNAQATINATGGTTPLQYSIDNINYQPSTIFTGLAQGNYTAYVQDANSCTATASFTITQANGPTISSVSTTQATCGLSNGQATINATGGTTPLQYSIDNINYQPSALFTGLAQGNYTAYVQDANSCMATASFSIAQANGPTISAIGATQATCGLSNGQATINATGGTTPLQYSIDNINYQPTAFFTGLAQGNYTAYVQDANSCMATASFLINQANGPTITSVDTTQATCGSSNGQATINATGGTAPLEYSIDNINYQATTIFSGLAQGVYTAYVQDSNSCTTTASFTIIQANGPAINSVSTTQAICGLSNGQAIINATGGTTPLQYSIDNINYQATALFTGLAQGSYTAYVQDVNSCTATASFTITQANGPAINSVSTIQATCGLSNGQATINATGGTTPLQYSIDNINYQPSALFTGLAQGNYTAYVQDANSCTATTSFAISQANGPTINSVSTTQATCGSSNGQATINATGGTTPLQYSIDNINYQPTALFTGLAQGNYTAYVQDANSCTATASFAITNANGPAISSVSTTQATCGLSNGQATINASGGTTPLQYSIDNVNYQPSGLFTGLSQGNYTAYVQDANACMATVPFTIIQANGPDIDTITTVNTDCGLTNGALQVFTIGGTAPLEFSINGGPIQTDSLFTGLAEGGYTVLVTDANGCMATANAQVLSNAPPTIDSISIKNAICINNSGELTIYASGTNPPLQYSIDNGNNFQPSNTFIELTSGQYDIVVADAGGCTATVLSDTLKFFDGPSLQFFQGITDAYCGQSNGQIVILSIGGTAPLQYSIDGGTTYQPSDSFPNLPSGPYVLVVEDANGCADTRSVVIDDNPPPILSATSVVQPACGMSSGSITVLVTANGVPPYLYSIDGGPFTANNTFSSLAQNTYSIIVEDSKNCYDTISVSLTDIAGPTIDLVQKTDATCGNNNGSLTILVSGATPPFQYSNDNGVTYQSSNVFTGLSPLTYTIVVKDANGCTSSAQETILDLSGPKIDSLGITNAACGMNSGEVIIYTSGGSSPVTYSLDNINFQASNSFSGLSPIAYTFYVIDANNCSVDTSITLLDLPGPIIDSLTIDHPDCGMANGFLQINTSSGTLPFLYSIDGGSTFVGNPQFSNLLPGTFNIVVKDANNCQYTNIASLQNQNGPTIVGITSTLSNCDSASGSLYVQAVGGTMPYTYNWNTTPPQTTELATGLSIGTYTVTITDASGCLVIGQEVVNNPVAQQANLGPDQVICGITSLVLDPGIVGTMLWSTGSTSSTITVTAAGIYSVTVTDAYNCEAVDSITITEIPFSPSAGGDTTIVEGEPAPLWAAGGLAYEWWPIDALSCVSCPNPEATPVDTTVYYVAVTGTGNCVDTLVVTVNVVESLDEIIVIPDVISPNDDGMNDEWIIPNIELFPNNRLTIVNRWGDVVFAANPYMNNWRGEYKGKLLPQGTYYYVLELDVNAFRRQVGAVTLLR